MSGAPTPLARAARQTLTIARRDFVATVATPVFLLFLFAPLIFASFSLIGGLGAASVSDTGRGDATRLVVVADPARWAGLKAADARLRGVFRSDEAPPALLIHPPVGDPAGTARALFAGKDYDAVAALYGPLGRPTILVGRRGDRAASYLAALAGETLVDAALGTARPKVDVRRIAYGPSAPTQRQGHESAFFAVFGVFFLTLFLASQMVGTMAEERNNKVIEVLAAAAPLEAVFLGKLVGMFAVAVLFVAFWTTVAGQVGALLPASVVEGLGTLAPAVGKPAFWALFVAYFTTAYLLLGAVFLGVGAQATTPREIQMLSLPITIVQVAMFALASAAASHPGTTLARVAEWFPLSSPFAMAGRAANRPEIAPHLLAIGWQALWVALFIWAGARLFRRGVLQSGSARGGWRRRAG